MLRGGQRGAALAYVLALLALLGVLTSLVIRYTRFNDALVARDRWDAQARLLAWSGIDHALSRIDPTGPPLDLGFATDGVEYRPEDANLSFLVRVATRGLMARAESAGRTRLPAGGREKRRSALIGQGIDLAALPALGLLNREGNMVLAGHAQVTGPVLLWRGGVRKATDYQVRWQGGGAGHAGPVWDSTAVAWKKVEPDFRRAMDWVEAQETLLSGGDLDEDPDYDSGAVTDLVLGDTGRLEDTALAGARIRAGRTLIIGSGADLLDCKLLAPVIRIGEGARLESVLAFATRTLEVTEAKVKGGQYAALDSLSLDLSEPLENWPIFYVQGRKVKGGTPDSAYLGTLRIRKAAGEGLFLVSAPERPSYDQEIRLILEAASATGGLAYCNGYARVEGAFSGSILCRNLKFEHEGTIWLGHLKDARLQGYTTSKVIPAPLLFPGFPVLSFGGDLP